MARLTPPLNPNLPMTDKDGKPTPFFMRWWQEQVTSNAAIADLSTPEAVSAVLDVLGAEARGQIMYRGASIWEYLDPDTAGKILVTNGVGADPSWSTFSGALDGIGNTQGDVLYRGAAGWEVLGYGTVGDVLSTNGIGDNPAWITPSAGGSTISITAPHWRIFRNASPDPNFVGMAELGWNGTTTGGTIGGTPDASSRFSTTFNEDKAFDGNLTTGWATLAGQISNAWISWDFGTTTVVTEFYIHPGTSPAYAPTDFDLQCSLDGVNWITVQNYTTTWVTSVGQAFTVDYEFGGRWTDLIDTPSAFGTALQQLRVNSGATALEFFTAPATVTDFTDLGDTPGSLGTALQQIRVNAGATALEFFTASSASTFTGLTDTPANFTGSALLFARVNAGETALEFAAGGGGAAAFTDLTDTPGTLGTAGQIPAVNTGATALEWIDAPTGGGGGVTAGTPAQSTIDLTTYGAADIIIAGFEAQQALDITLRADVTSGTWRPLIQISNDDVPTWRSGATDYTFVRTNAGFDQKADSSSIFTGATAVSGSQYLRFRIESPDDTTGNQTYSWEWGDDADSQKLIGGGDIPGSTGSINQIKINSNGNNFNSGEVIVRTRTPSATVAGALPGGWELIEERDASTSAAVNQDFAFDPDLYDEINVAYRSLDCTASGSFRISLQLLKTGATVAVNDARYARYRHDDGFDDTDIVSAAWQFNLALSTPQTQQFVLTGFGSGGPIYCQMDGTSGTGTSDIIDGAGFYDGVDMTAGVIDGIRIFDTGGGLASINSGTIYVIGRRKPSAIVVADDVVFSAVASAETTVILDQDLSVTAITSTPQEILDDLTQYDEIHIFADIGNGTRMEMEFSPDGGSTWRSTLYSRMYEGISIDNYDNSNQTYITVVDGGTNAGVGILYGHQNANTPTYYRSMWSGSSGGTVYSLVDWNDRDEITNAIRISASSTSITSGRLLITGIKTAVTGTISGAVLPGNNHYDIGSGFSAVPTSSQVLEVIMCGREITFPANFTGAVGNITTNPTVSFVINVDDDGVTIGTITISTGGVFTFATTSGTEKVVAAGSKLEFVAPSTVDTTAAGGVWTLLGSAT